MILLHLLPLVMLVPVLIWPLLPVRHKPRWLDFLPLAALLLAGVAFVVDLYRVRTIPILLAVLLVFVFTLPRLFRPSTTQPRRRGLAIAGGVLGLLLVLAAAAVPLALLPFKAGPAPTGELAVGTVTYHWVDANRPEMFTPDPDDRREVVVQFWYPAGGEPGGYTAREGVPVSSARPTYPLLIFSHGAGGLRQSNVSTFMELASHGYIVGSLDHPYHTSFTTLSDGRCVFVSPEFMQRAMNGELTGVEALRFGQEAMDIRAGDLLFALDQVQVLDGANGALAGRINWERIGFFGHSMGGAAAVQVCRQDARCQAALVLDGTLLGDRVDVAAGDEQVLVEAPFPQPLLQMAGDLYDDPGMRETAYHPNRMAHQRAADAAYFLVVEGMGHMNFGNLPLVSPVLAAQLGGLGEIDAGRGLDIVNAYTLAFFDEHLQGKPSPLLDGATAAYPEVTFEARNTE